MSRACAVDGAAAALAGLALLVFGSAAPAATEIKFTAEQTAAVGEVSKFINGFKTLQGEFTQTGPKGNVSRGVFYLQKPGKMRFEYAAPNPFVIVSDGSWVTIKNRSKDKADQYPLSQTPLAPGSVRPHQHSEGSEDSGCRGHRGSRSP